MVTGGPSGVLQLFKVVPLNSGIRSWTGRSNMTCLPLIDAECDEVEAAILLWCHVRSCDVKTSSSYWDFRGMGGGELSYYLLWTVSGLLWDPRRCRGPADIHWTNDFWTHKWSQLGFLIYASAGCLAYYRTLIWAPAPACSEWSCRGHIIVLLM